MEGKGGHLTRSPETFSLGIMQPHTQACVTCSLKELLETPIQNSVPCQQPEAKEDSCFLLAYLFFVCFSYLDL